MFTMLQVCQSLDISYETLRFYCNEGLVPNVKRDANNYRQFDDRDVDWLRGLLCLKRCGMRVKDMKIYMQLCRQGADTILQRKEILRALREKLLSDMAQIESSLCFVDEKQQFYDAVLSGKMPYRSNLINTQEPT